VHAHAAVSYAASVANSCKHLQVDRSTMGLYYSGNGFDWHTAGIVDYHLVRFPLPPLLDHGAS
jgi:hypothetical protein